MTAYFCSLCFGSGYIMAEAKARESDGAPYAFRCECSEGRAKASTGIPLWSPRYAKSYELYKGPKIADPAPVDPTLSKHSREPGHVEPEAVKPVSDEARAGVGILKGAAFLQLEDCVTRSKAGQPLQHQQAFGQLVKQYGKEAVLAAVRSIRLRDSEPKVASTL